MLRSVSGGDEGRGNAQGRRNFQDTLQRGCGGSNRSGQSQRGSFDAPSRQQAEQLRGLIKAFLDILRALSDRFGGGQKGGGMPMPVEPDGGIGDGAGPPDATTLAVGEEDGGGIGMPVEPDGGIGDGAGPPEFTTLALGEEDGGGDFGPIPVDPDDGKPPEATTLAIGEEDGGGIGMPVEPDGGIGDGAGPPPFVVDGEERFPVEPDGGIGDGAGPPEVTTLALGEEDGGGLDPAPRGGIPANDIATYGRSDT